METFEGSTADAVELGLTTATSSRGLGMLALLGALSAFGPLSMDMYLAGVAAFAVPSAACAAAPGIGLLITLRFLQGMAGATGVVPSLAMVRDLYGRASAREVHAA